GESVRYVRYNPENPPKVAQNGDGTLKIEVTDETLNQPIVINSDMLVLSTPLAAREDSKQLAQLLKVPVDRNGFFFEAHVKLRPVDFATDGIFLCGAAHGPKDIKDSVAQANGAAARALVLLTKSSVKVEAITCEVDQEKCIGCGICVQLCPYGAPQIDGGKTKIIEVLCKGCGACAVSCPTHAITSHQFKDEYYMAQIAALLSE
ncbi:MAG: 4Fe-4S binding protein, partial [Candidatus Hydrothermarchaeota archaeon]|nr:4Fe-4S binding protein [Candidatus Hydrothermarchaeota archaeon]